MYGKAKLSKLAQAVLTASKADETEVVISADDFNLTRFANNQIHQNVARNSVHFTVRVVVGKKIGVVGGDDISQKGIAETVGGAFELAKTQAPDPDWPGLPDPKKVKLMDAFDESTAKVTPRARALKVKNVISAVISAKMTAFGALSDGVTEYLVANSRGVIEYFPSTRADFNLVVMAGEATGFGSDLSSRFSELKIDSEVQQAIKFAKLGKQPKSIPPGEYEVVLAPAAVNEMLTYLSYLGFGARAYHEDRSFISGKLGKKVFNSKISLTDDGLDPKMLPLPFDFEGQPRQEVRLVEKGVAHSVVYDHYLAAKYKAKSTGHALPAPNTLDAIAGHLKLKPGPKTNTTDKLIGGVKKGIYVTRFWYVNCHHHKSLTITGLTRDGTFLIENGRLTKPLNNLRFTQSIVEALSGPLAVGGEPKLVDSWLGANSVPSLRLKKFRFTGVSELGK